MNGLDDIWLCRNAGLVQRMHIVPTIREHNVAEHTYNAMVIARELCNQAKLGIAICRSVMEYLLYHDIEEVYTGDLPAYLKSEEELSGVIKMVEERWSRAALPFHISEIKESSIPIVKQLAKISDCLELCMFCIEEIERGNRHPMLISTTERALEYATKNSESLSSEAKRVVDSWLDILDERYRRNVYGS